MKTDKQAFSIIEVVTASIILSIAVFWIFKLIAENKKIINNSNNYNTANSLFLSFKECIQNKTPNSNIQDNKTFYINLNDCAVSPTTATWITIDNIDYSLYWSWIWDNTFDLYIKNDNLKLNQKFVLK